MMTAISFAEVKPARDPQLPAAPLPEVTFEMKEHTGVMIDSGMSESGWHRLERAEKCLRMAGLAEILNEDPGDKKALERGALVHIGLAHHYARWACRRQGSVRIGNTLIRSPDDVLPWEYAVLRRAQTGPVAQQQYPNAVEMIKAYIDYAISRDNFWVHGIEVEVRCDVGGFLFTMRWDLVIEGSGGIEVWDHKTAARAAQAIMGYALSGQIHAARMIARRLFGPRFRTFILNMVGSESPYTVTRAEPPPCPEGEAGMPWLIWNVNREIAALKKSGLHPWWWPPAYSETTCYHRYGKCGFYELCLRSRQGAPPPPTVPWSVQPFVLPDPR